MNKPHESVTPAGPSEVIRQMEQAIAGGKHWYLALLDAIAKWTPSYENLDGHSYQYLIRGEAFDWLLLAERLCLAIGDLIPEAEKASLLFYGKPPIDLPPEKLKEIIGPSNTTNTLTFFMGLQLKKHLFWKWRRRYVKNDGRQADTGTLIIQTRHSGEYTARVKRYC